MSIILCFPAIISIFICCITSQRWWAKEVETDVCVCGGVIWNIFFPVKIVCSIYSIKKHLDTFHFCKYTAVDYSTLFLVMISEVMLIRLHDFFEILFSYIFPKKILSGHTSISLVFKSTMKQMYPKNKIKDSNIIKALMMFSVEPPM